jgi:hypothetical protein
MGRPRDRHGPKTINDNVPLFFIVEPFGKIGGSLNNGRPGVRVNASARLISERLAGSHGVSLNEYNQYLPEVNDRVDTAA